MPDDTPEQRAALDALLHRGAEEMRERADRIDPWMGAQDSVPLSAREQRVMHRALQRSTRLVPDLDGEWDYKGDDPVWQILYRWHKRYATDQHAGLLFLRSDRVLSSLADALSTHLAAAQQQARRAALEEAVKAIEDEAAKFLSGDAETDKDIGHSLKFASAIVNMLYAHPLNMLAKYAPPAPPLLSKEPGEEKKP